MWNTILRSFGWILLFLLGLALTAVAKAPDEVGLAITAIGTGSVTELRTRLITDRIMVFDDEARTRAKAALPSEIRDHRVTQGRLLRRLEQIFSQVLLVHERTRSSLHPELFLFEGDTPAVQIWRGRVLVISTGLAEPLYDGELAGIFAHELGHSYFADEMIAAQRQQALPTMRLVELKCDAVALLSLKLLGHDPGLYLKGLQRIQVINKRQSRSSGIFLTHPNLVARAQFAERFIKLLS